VLLGKALYSLAKRVPYPPIPLNRNSREAMNNPANRQSLKIQYLCWLKP